MSGKDSWRVWKTSGESSPGLFRCTYEYEACIVPSVLNLLLALVSNQNADDTPPDFAKARDTDGSFVMRGYGDEILSGP
jgi:hypothetical protein